MPTFAVRRCIRAFVLIAAVAAVPITGLPSLSASASSVTSDALTTSPTPGDAERSDSVSASDTARQSGHSVEDLSQRTETSQVFANPDGTWTSQEALGPVRVHNEDGSWSDIDTKLQLVDGGFAPKHAATGLVLSDGGDKTFATMAEDGKDLSWNWPTDLPAPEVDGNTAIYHDAVAGGDLVVTATPTGFSHDIVLNERPDDAVTFPVPLVTDGSIVEKEGDGDLSIATKAGDDLFSAPAPVMYDADAAGSPGGEPGSGEAVAVDTTLTKSAGGATLTLAPDSEFLADPNTIYPVTIDPTWRSVVANDAWVQSTSPTAKHPLDESLYVGTKTGGTTIYRSYLQFVTSGRPWLGQVVSSANLALRNYETIGCTGSAVRVSRVLEPYDNSTLTWTNKPPVTSSGASDSWGSHGATGCDADWMNWNLTDIVRLWAAGTANNGIAVHGVNENANSSYRAFRSDNYGSAPGTYWPYLSVTYNSYPDPPSGLTVSPSQAQTTATTTPTLTATVSDPDGGTVKGYFKVFDGADVVWADYGSPVTGSAAINGGPSTVTIPSGKLVSGKTYRFVVYGSDGSLFSGKDATAGGYAQTTMTVDTGQPPATPSELDVSPVRFGYAETETPQVSAVLNDPAGGLMTGHFELRDSSTGEVAWSADVAQSTAGSRVTADVDADSLDWGTRYTLFANAQKGGRTSLDASAPPFVVIPLTGQQVTSACSAPCNPLAAQQILAPTALQPHETRVLQVSVPNVDPDDVGRARLALSLSNWAQAGSITVADADYNPVGRPTVTYGDTGGSGPVNAVVDTDVSDDVQIAVTNNGSSAVTIAVQNTGWWPWETAADVADEEATTPSTIDYDSVEESDPGEPVELENDLPITSMMMMLDEAGTEEGADVPPPDPNAETAPPGSDLDIAACSDTTPEDETCVDVSYAESEATAVETLESIEQEAGLDAEIPDTAADEDNDADSVPVAGFAARGTALTTNPDCTSPRNQWWVTKRFNACLNSYDQLVMVRGNKVVGTGLAIMVMKQDLDPKTRDVQLKWRFRLQRVSGQLKTVRYATRASCYTGCAMSGDWTNHYLTMADPVSPWSHATGTTPMSAAAHNVQLDVQIRGYLNGGPTIATSGDTLSAPARCDGALYVPGYGCVFPQFTPVFELRSSNQAIKESVAHIRRFQQRHGIMALNRLYDPPTKRKNRRAAKKRCSSLPGSGDCDEHPFASTHQGCFLRPSLCSVEKISPTDNRLVGSMLGNFYGARRLLDNDKFYVEIVP